MRTRTKYDSLLVWMYVHHKEHLIPDDIRSQIPYTTIATWQKTDYTSYFGYSMRGEMNDSLSLMANLQEHKSLKQVVKVITKTWIAISDVVLPTLLKTKKHSALLVNEVQRLTAALPLHFCCKLLGISQSVYRYRLTSLLYNCSFSEFQLCMKKHPAQLTNQEVQKIKELGTDVRFACWPLSSIYYYGLRENILAMGLSTFYKYAKILGLQRKFSKPPNKTSGIKADRPNAFLHIDTTFVSLPSLEKMALVFVSDNYSRAIL